jgi:hypothetical protein
MLYLETYGHKITQRTRVQIFGEFSSGLAEGAWGKKLNCVYNDQIKAFEVAVCIRLGQRFKFIIDGGRDYVVS